MLGEGVGQCGVGLRGADELGDHRPGGPPGEQADEGGELSGEVALDVAGVGEREGANGGIG